MSTYFSLNIIFTRFSSVALTPAHFLMPRFRFDDFFVKM